MPYAFDVDDDELNDLKKVVEVIERLTIDGMRVKCAEAISYNFTPTGIGSAVEANIMVKYDDPEKTSYIKVDITDHSKW